MNNIIVPVDFSDDSLNALDHAILIANKLGKNITMLHVKRKKAYYKNKLGMESFDIGDDDHAIAYLDEITEKVKDNIENQIDYKLRKGKIFQEVINQAKYTDAHMIVMGTHGISGFEGRWIGSNAYRVVSNSPCPVVTIRMDYMLKGFNKIVIPIDTSDETRQKVPFLVDFAKKFEAEVFIASVRETNKKAAVEKLEYYTKQAEEYVNKVNLICNTETLVGRNLSEMVIEYALSIGGQLIGIMTEITESTRNIWLGPYAQQMVNHSPVPVISFQPY